MNSSHHSNQVIKEYSSPSPAVISTAPSQTSDQDQDVDHNTTTHQQPASPTMAAAAVHHEGASWSSTSLAQRHHQQQQQHYAADPRQTSDTNGVQSFHQSHFQDQGPQRPSAEASRGGQASGTRSIHWAHSEEESSGAQGSQYFNQQPEQGSPSKRSIGQSSSTFDRSYEGISNLQTENGAVAESAQHIAHSYNPSQSFGADGHSGLARFDSSSHEQFPPTTGLVRQPLQSRFFGLSPTLQVQTSLADPAFFPGGIVPPETAETAGGTLDANEKAEGSKEVPRFSIELKARSFDHRGYPVYGGKAAPISGVVRMSKSEDCDVSIMISAHTTSGSTATVWDGIALQPATNGSERTVFFTTDTFTASEGHVEYIRTASSVSSPSASSSSTKTPGCSEDENGVLAIPFTTNLPVGGSTQIVDGEITSVDVPLPPSFEMSSEQDNKEKAVLKSMNEALSGGNGTSLLASGAASFRTGRTRMTAMSVKEAVEAGLQQVYRVGCFYRITFTLIPTTGKVQESGRKLAGVLFGSKKSRAAKKLKGSRTLSVPFVFLGEMNPQTPVPSTLPPIRPTLLKQPNEPLAPGWVSEVAMAKWSGMFFKTMRRNVELELFLPGKIVQAPSVVPVLLVIRPEDPDMLPKPFPASLSASSPRPGLGRGISVENGSSLHAYHSPIENGNHSAPAALSSSSGSSSTAGGAGGQFNTSSTVVSTPPPDSIKESDESTPASGGSGLSQMMQSSMSISHSPAHATSASNQPSQPTSSAATSTYAPSVKKKISRSTFSSFYRRPDSAQSRASSDDSNMSYTVRGGGGGSSMYGEAAFQVGLPALVRVSILQNVYYSSSNVNEPPKNKRRLMNVADLEEIDIGKLAEGHAYGDLSLLNDSPNAAALAAEAKAGGVRLLRGLLRIPREATPSFRVQGIEVKYAIKVDLLPFNTRTGVIKSTGQQGIPPPMLTKRTASSSKLPPSASSSPPVTPPSVRPSTLSFAALGPVNNRGSQMGSNSSASTHQMSTSTSHLPHNTVWSPGAAVPLSLQHHHHHSYEASLRGSQAASSSGGGGGSGGNGRTRTSMDTTDAGFSRRSPSDQTIIGTESAKLHKTVGALWVNVRLVKGKGSI